MQQTTSRIIFDEGATVVTEDDVRRIFADTFKLAAGSVTPDMSPESVDAWDSFGHMQLVTALETNLGVRLAMEQIVAIDSFATLCRILEEAGSGE